MLASIRCYPTTSPSLRWTPCSLRPRSTRLTAFLNPSVLRWPIPWFEFDGDQWHPQPLVHTLESTINDAAQKGCQGILGIHWRTRGIAENYAYLNERAWEPKLTADEFFRRYAATTYAPAIAAAMGTIHSSLDNLGYRWVGGDGQGDCQPFHLGPPRTPEKSDALQKLRAQAVALLPQAGASTDKLNWLIHQMDWVLSYNQAEVAGAKAQSLLAEGKATEALAVLDAGDLPMAVRAFAANLTTRGEYGVLSEINTKAVFRVASIAHRLLGATSR